MIAESLLKNIDRGRKGLNHGFSMGLPKIESVVCGIFPKCSTVVFSPTGVGKSSIVLYAYVYAPLKEHLEDGLYTCDYFSLEMSADDIYAKLLCIYMFETYGIDISLNEILSRKKGYILPDDIYLKVQESMGWIHKVEKVVHVYDDMANAEKIYAIMKHTAELNGKFSKIGKHVIYTPNNSQQVRMSIVDHMSLLTPSNGRKTIKEEIDITSKYQISLREQTSATIVDIMQSNRESASIDRRKAGLSDMRISDIKDSGNPAQDAYIVISLFSPQREKLSSHNGYDISILKDHFRSVQILKNRFGEADKEVGLNFFGHNGMWHELPKPDEINDMSIYTNPNYLLNKDKQEIKKDEETKKTFNFVV